MAELDAPEFWNEFRAVYTRPASLLESDEDRARGYIVHRTEWFKSPLEAKHAATKNSEETHASYVSMEESWVIRTAPKPSGS